jgi:hypothetical protein
MEMEQDSAIRTNEAQTFKRLGFPAPDTNLAVDEYGLNTSIITSYSAFRRQKYGLLGDLIRLHRGEELFYRRSNKHFFVPAAELPNKGRWTHIVANGVIPTIHTPLPPQETPPANHKSSFEAFPLLIRDIATGDLLASKQIFLSPSGGAPQEGKPLTECARIVHDESFPRSGA